MQQEFQKMKTSVELVSVRLNNYVKAVGGL